MLRSVWIPSLCQQHVPLQRGLAESLKGFSRELLQCYQHLSEGSGPSCQTMQSLGGQLHRAFQATWSRDCTSAQYWTCASFMLWAFPRETHTDLLGLLFFTFSEEAIERVLNLWLQNPTDLAQLFLIQGEFSLHSLRVLFGQWRTKHFRVWSCAQKCKPSSPLPLLLVWDICVLW